MTRLFESIRQRFPSLFKKETERGWAAINPEGDGSYALYSGEGKFLGVYLTKNAAVKAAELKGLYIVE